MLSYAVVHSLYAIIEHYFSDFSREPEAALSHCPAQYMKLYEVPSVSPTYTESHLVVGHFLRGPGLVMVPISRLWRPSPTLVLWPHLHIITGSLSTCFSMKLGDEHQRKIMENHGASRDDFMCRPMGFDYHIVTCLCWFPLGLLLFVSFKQFVATEIHGNPKVAVILQGTIGNIGMLQVGVTVELHRTPLLLYSAYFLLTRSLSR